MEGTNAIYSSYIMSDTANVPSVVIPYSRININRERSWDNTKVTILPYSWIQFDT